MILEESTIVITGASGNIGKCLVNSLSKRTKKIIAIDLNFGSNLEFDNNVDNVTLDVTKEKEIETFFSILENKGFSSFGLINGAGVIFNRPLVNILDRKSPIHSSDDFERVLKLNLTGSFLMGSHFANFCIKSKKKACIINVSSVTAAGNIGQTAYSASKAGVESMARVWAKELGMFKIRAASISPGFFNTESTHRNLSEAIVKKYQSQIPLKKFGELEQLVHAFEFVLTNDYFNGEVLSLNGGYRV
ncbi:SDR family NAD(P)-dependent oxidoreductase [Vicingaceae bacterium]|nr:SDR family NAD(P)-dependent oxidoreductase [Vicingaceae bacterium]